jgi:hypothetical protein
LQGVREKDKGAFVLQKTTKLLHLGTGASYQRLSGLGSEPRMFFRLFSTILPLSHSDSPGPRAPSYNLSFIQ